MKRVFLYLTCFFLLAACEDKPKDDKGIQAESSGNINNLSVVMPRELWDGEIGEAVRTQLASPVDGLHPEEPLFSISQMPPESFSGFARRNRIFLYVEKGKPAGVRVSENPFAKPQIGIFVYGETNDEIISQIEENRERIIELFKNTELKERQRRVNKSLGDESRLKESLGVSLEFPSAYRYAKEGEGFFWLRRDMNTGMMEILIYEVPLERLEGDADVIDDIVAMRDSIGEKYIPGRLEGSYMITESAYAPFLFESQIDGKFAYETRGMWEVNNDFMGGPFLNYAVRDEKNNRYVILEGFMFRPSASKRDHMFELEAILRSAEIQ